MPTIEITDSKSIRKIDWDGTFLDATFANGRTYRYSGVPEELFYAIKAVAESGSSVGSVFAQSVVRGGYEYEEVTA